MSNIKIYDYLECGLDNVRLYNISFIKDEKGEDVVYIPKVNKLHKVISLGIISKQGKITGKELRFLRTEMGLKQSELADLIGKDGQTVGRWEREEHPLDSTADILIRTVAREFLGLYQEDIKIEDFSVLTKEKDSTQINIDASNNSYELMPTCA